MKTAKSISLDRIGITASTACAIHCAVLPFVITLLPLWGIEFLASPSIEIMMIVLSLTLGIWSLSKSYRNAHHRLGPILTLILGFLFIAVGHFAGIEMLEPILIPLGGFTIATAHYINLKFTKTCNHKH